MPEKSKSMIEELRKWSVTGMVALLIFAGKSTVRDVVREEVGELQKTVRRLEIQVAQLEANAASRENRADFRKNNP